MLQSTGLLRVGHNLVTEQQQKGGTETAGLVREVRGCGNKGKAVEKQML